MKIEELNLGRKYYLPVKVTNFECETNSTEVVVTLESLSRRHQLVDFGTNIMNELVEIDLKIVTNILNQTNQNQKCHSSWLIG
ncbi:hypothetical protein ABG808_07410 [Streptococcus iniae]